MVCNEEKGHFSTSAQILDQGTMYNVCRRLYIQWHFQNSKLSIDKKNIYINILLNLRSQLFIGRSAVSNVSGNRCQSHCRSRVACSILAWSHTFVKIDHEIISTVILLAITTLRDVCYNARWFWTTVRYGSRTKHF